MADKNDAVASPSNSSDSNDQEFVLTAELMIDGEDYEGTIDEEEEMEDDDDEDELAELQKESEMPIDELLAIYSEDKADGNSNIPDNAEGQDEMDPFQNQRITRGIAALKPQYFLEDDYTSDEEYQPNDDWKKEIQIGEDYQAVVDEGISPYLPDEKTLDEDDKLLWTPNVVTSEKLQSYLDLVYKLTEFSSQHSERDDEQALFTLLQTKDINAALKKRQEQDRQSSDISLWSEEECQNFEQGLRMFSKDFRLIQKNKVQTRSVGEIVQFYYLWKKTERHDAFVTQTKLGRKKYTLPGISDMMGRFMEENDSLFSSRSASPSTHENNEYTSSSNNLLKPEIKKEDIEHTATTNNISQTDRTHSITPGHVVREDGLRQARGDGTMNQGHDEDADSLSKGRVGDIVNEVRTGGNNFSSGNLNTLRHGGVTSKTTPEDSWRTTVTTTSITVGISN